MNLQHTWNLISMRIIYFVCAITILTSCQEKPVETDPIPKHDNFSIDSEFVDEVRVINVWTPEGYSTKTDSLPVLYMPDGGIKEDFPHVANTLAKLIENKSIPPIILVGIENTERGRDMTGPSSVEDDAQYCPITDGAINFRAFITEELFADIDMKYRTTNEKGIIGESLAGLFVMETFFLSPQCFDFFIAIDPSLWWNGSDLEKNAGDYLKMLPSEEKRLWFAGSSAEDISNSTRNLEKTLLNQAPTQLIWKYSDEPNEEHHTIFRATKEKALIWTLSPDKTD